MSRGTTKSCGCGSVAQARRNLAASASARKIPFAWNKKLKDVFGNMIARTEYGGNKRWAHYGGKGVKICTEWRKDRRKFYKWAMDNGYRDGLQIDRINVDGDYEPTNCRFVDAFTQMNNTTRNHFIEWQGERKTISQWARSIGMRPQALQHRIDRGWSVPRALTQKPRGWPSRK